jgi:hypothetical protein
MEGAIAEERRLQLARKLIHPVTENQPVNVTKSPEMSETKGVTKPYETKLLDETKLPNETKPPPETKVTKIGRPCLGNKPMSSTERVRKHRARLRKARQRVSLHPRAP